jgi:hypothetical protein
VVIAQEAQSLLLLPSCPERLGSSFQNQAWP